MPILYLYLYSANPTYTQVIKSNSPFPVDAPDSVYMVKSGVMAVFAIATTNGNPQGSRRYLFDVAEGDALFGIATVLESQSHKLIAVPYEETQLVSIPLNNYYCG